MTIYRHRVSGPGTAGDIWTTTLHSSGAANLSTVHSAWNTFISAVMTSTLRAMWPNEQAATETVTDQLNAVTGKNEAQTRTSISQVGTGTGATISPRTSVVIGLRTALPTKAGRGRMYWPPVDSNHLTPQGQLASADALAIAQAFGNALTTFKATSQPIVLHRATMGIDPVTYVSVGVVLGTQRRRTNKVANSYSTQTV